MITSSNHEDQIQEWKNIKEEKMNELFLQSNPSLGNTDFTEQYSRIIGIDFGSINTTIRNQITNAIAINMHLAVNHGVFNVIIEIVTPSSNTYYSHPSDGGPLYRLHFSPMGPHWTPKMWVGFFINLWLRSDFKVNSCFNSIYRQPSKNEANHSVGIFPALRAHYYPIKDIRLEHIQNIVKEENNNSNIRFQVLFGLDILEMVEGTELFTLIFEVSYDNPNSDERKYDYINFVGACPPACSGSGSSSGGASFSM